MFKIGQKVVCKNVSASNVFNSVPYGIAKGKIYTITAIANCPNCKSLLLELAESTHRGGKWCAKCDCKLSSANYYHAFRFEPITYDFISAKEIVAEQIQEKSDLPLPVFVPS